MAPLRPAAPAPRRGAPIEARSPAPRPGPAPRALRPRRPVLGVDDDAVQHPQADGEDAQRPERIDAADREQRLDRPDARADDADRHPVRVAGSQREATGELDDPDD